MKRTIKNKLSYLGLAVMALCMWSCSGAGNDGVQYLPVQLSDDGAWCFINGKGERVGTQEWEFMPTVTVGGIFTARTDSGLTVYKWKGDVAQPIDSLQNLVSVGVMNEGLMPVTPPMQRIRVVNNNGDVEFVLNPINGQEITSCSIKFSDGLLIVNTTDGKAGVVDKKGNVVFEPKYNEISDFKNGYALAANYNYDEYEKGPSYFVLSKDGTSTPVKGQFGFGEGECFNVPEFEAGSAVVVGELDTTNYEYDFYKINIDAKAQKIKDIESVYELSNGDIVTTKWDGEKQSMKWVNEKGEPIIKAEGYTSVTGNYVIVHGEDSLKIYNEKAQQIASFASDENWSVDWAGGAFGPIMRKYDMDYTSSEFLFLDKEGKKLETPKIYGVGYSEMLTLDEEEIICREWVTSAYVDVTAAASKLVSFVTNGIHGKSYYYLGESVKTILDGENARYFSGSDRTFSIPTDSTGRLASGDGFWISGTGKSDRSMVQDTYSRYFEVHHYDYWGRAWGYNRTRKTGVQFNPSAKVEMFDLQLHTNHPSGARLREAVDRRIKKEGYTLVSSGPNYEEFTDGSRNVIVYASNESKGIGVVIFQKNEYYLSDSEKSALAANLY